MKTKIVKLADLTPDPTNANDGTEYGGRSVSYTHLTLPTKA